VKRSLYLVIESSVMRATWLFLGAYSVSKDIDWLLACGATFLVGPLLAWWRPKDCEPRAWI
jgi:hypothetical protein